MRDYLSFPNLGKAAILGAVMTVMAAPRILMSGFPPSYVLAAYAGLITFGGMATAWSRYAGMRGLFPPRKVMLTGIAIAAGLLVVLLPVQVNFFNPVFYAKILSVENTGALNLLFPQALPEGIALMLWAMSFETLFFQAAAMSFFAKLTGKLRIAIALTVAFRILIAWLKLGEVGIISGGFVVLLLVAILSLVSSMLFAFYGLPAVMLLSGGLALSRWVFLWQ